MKRVLPFRRLPIAAALLVFGCSQDSRPVFAPKEAPPNFDQGDAGCKATCSPDGRSLVDCNGEAKECPADLGCHEGACIPACEAASAAASTIGCEYFAARPSVGETALVNDSCYAVLIANVWHSPAAIQLEYGGEQLSTKYVRIPRDSGSGLYYDLLPDGQLPPGQMAIAFLSDRPAPGHSGPPCIGAIASTTHISCPADVGAAVAENPQVSGTGRGKTFRITTSAPVIAYDIYPYGGATSYLPSASLLFATSAWGKNYMAFDGYAGSGGSTPSGSYIQLLASEDDTTVKLRPTVDITSSSTVPGGDAGSLVSLTLHRGEFVQYGQRGSVEVNGTPIEADKPIAVVGGNTCVFIPQDKWACDSLHQQLPAISLMGSQYAATRYRDRASRSNATNDERVPWRIMGTVDGTRLSYDPPVDGAPATIDGGAVVEFLAPGPFVVRTQDKDHPIYLASYMTGGGLGTYECRNGVINEGIVHGQGDPEFVNVVPSDQYLSSYLFLTDFTYPNTNLVFVRERVDGRYDDVYLDCVGKVDGWTDIGGTDLATRLDIQAQASPVGECTNGAHRAWSESPFGLTVWGFGPWASYGYPAGMSAKPINSVNVPTVPR